MCLILIEKVPSLTFTGRCISRLTTSMILNKYEERASIDPTKIIGRQVAKNKKRKLRRPTNLILIYPREHLL